MRLRSIFPAALLTTAVTIAAAGESRIPIDRPVMITSPGSYVLTSDVSTYGVAIEVAAPDVILDLNGHSISLQGLGHVVQVDAGAGLWIRNGHLSGGDTALFSSLGATWVRVTGCDIDGSRDTAILITGAQSVVVTDTTIRGAGAGIHVTGVNFPTLTHILRNDISAAGGGIQLGPVSGEVASCVVATDTQTGILVSTSAGVLVHDNTVRSGRVGVNLTGPGNVVASNVIRGAAGTSIAVSADDNVLTGNTVTAGGADGVWVLGTANLVDANLVNANAGYGLNFASGSTQNVYRRNLLRFDGSGPVASSDPSNTDGGNNL